MPKGDDFDDARIERLTTLSGGRLKKALVMPTYLFQVDGADKEFVQLKKGEQWLVHALVCPMGRQRGLKRTRMVEDIVTAALAIVNVTPETFEDSPLAAPDPPPPDPMQAFGYEEDTPPPALQGDELQETPVKKPRLRPIAQAV